MSLLTVSCSLSLLSVSSLVAPKFTHYFSECDLTKNDKVLIGRSHPVGSMLIQNKHESPRDPLFC